jgi:hypothetical protein
MAGIQKHTKTPWAVNPFRAQIDAFDGGRDGDPQAVCKMLWPTDARSEAETEANAAFIVKAVNAHEQLVKALEAWIKHFGPIEDNEMLHEDCRAVYAMTRAALKAADADGG